MENKLYRINLQLFAEAGTIVNADLSKVRDLDFALRFETGIETLMKMLGTTRKIEKTDGAVLKVYKVTGTLLDGSVAEGADIPLSNYKTAYEPIGEVTLKKWRKATTAEAISSKGYAQAVNDTNAKMIKDIQKNIRTQFLTFLTTGTGVASGTGLQATLANVWGQLQVLWEDTAVEAVHFINPLDIADYLGGAQIITQTAFGLTYIENFLGLGTVILAADIPKGKVYTTAKENIVLYYINVAGGGLGQAFNFTSDSTGLIGIHTDPTYKNATIETIAMSGVGLFAEQLGGVVIGTIDGTGV